jgi:hypothetical protein
VDDVSVSDEDCVGGVTPGSTWFGVADDGDSDDVFRELVGRSTGEKVGTALSGF